MKPQYSPAESPNGYRLRYTEVQTKTAGICYSLLPEQILESRDELDPRFSWILERGRDGHWEVLESHGPDLKSLLSV